ncbi:hypothetical protein M514_22675 [Trichuris suis]|uniref:Uncharacterized protein n=1 Tax=Trichuris suis TaxID=68888 RepID=A0A085N6J9_9BILA|nr:hypothetical protein M514_22675 [Trichuris suis]
MDFSEGPGLDILMTFLHSPDHTAQGVRRRRLQNTHPAQVWLGLAAQRTTLLLLVHCRANPLFLHSANRAYLQCVCPSLSVIAQSGDVIVMEQVCVSACGLDSRYKTKAYTDGVVSPSDFSLRYRHFQSGEVDACDLTWSGHYDEDLQAPLDQSSAVTTQEREVALRVRASAVSWWVHAMSKIQKYGKRAHHKLSDSDMKNRVTTCRSLLMKQRRNSNFWQIVSWDEKWIMYVNPKRKRH